MLDNCLTPLIETVMGQSVNVHDEAPIGINPVILVPVSYCLVIHNPGTVLIGIFVAIIGFQLGLLYWKRKHSRSFSLVSLSLLWVVPFFMAVKNRFWRFPLVWIIYTLVNFGLFRMASQPKLDPVVPRSIYRFYRGLFNVTMGIAGFGYGLFLVNALVVPSLAVADLILTLIFYGLYFGVLSRDLVDFITERMAITIGVISGDHQ